MHSVLVNEADLYFLAPLRIKDYNTFKDNLISAGWVRPSDVPFDLYAQDALYESEAAFLGILKDGDSPLSKDGECFVAPEFPKEGTMLSHFRSTFKKKNTGKELTFAIRKKRQFEADPIWLEGLSMGNITRIHVSPDKTIAVFLLHFRMPQKENQTQSIKQVESTSYWLHKTDEQAPQIIVDGHPIPGFETVLEIIKSLINSSIEVASLYHPGRLLTATYVQVKQPKQMPDDEYDGYMKDLRDYVTHIGLSKDQAYDISEADKEETFNLFNNILVHASPEGFCGAFLVEEEQVNTGFMEKTSTTFLKSYLPIFIETVLVELSSVHMLDRRETNRLREQSERFRELKLMEAMPVSRYSHLLQLKTILSNALSIQPKIETVSEYLDTLREQHEQHQESNLNILIGFMGVGQVVFAILQIIGVEKLFGNAVVDSVLARNVSTGIVVMFIILTIAIIVLVVKALRRR